MESRRKIIMFNRVTADGYFSTPEGSLDWAVQDEDLAKRGADGIPGTDTVLFGRRTYQMFASYWPHVLDDSTTAPDPHGGERSKQQRAFAEGLTAMTKLVFSRTLKEVTWKNSQIIPALDPNAIEELKSQPGKDMIIFGSGSIVSQLTEHGLIDEYQFIVSPILLGRGKLLINGVAKRVKLDLLEATPFPSGNVMLRYGPA
jgi:dihydrofolate reductase